MPPIVTKSEFARLCGVAPASVTTATQSRVLKAALVKGKIDIAHPNAVEYIRRQMVKSKEYATGRKRSGAKTDKPILEPQYTPAETARLLQKEYPKDVRKLADKSLRELVSIFGTDQAFKIWLKSLVDIEDVHKKRLENFEREGKLVTREVVKTGIVEPFNQAHKQLLLDGAASLSKRLVTMIRAGADEEECEKYIRERLTSFIKSAKATVTRTLEGLK
jgi:hypothetical protein